MALTTRTWRRHRRAGIDFTELGFGTAPLGNLYRAVGDDEARAVLERAWAGGVRYYDTAPLYGLGLAEWRLGALLRDKPREDYVLSTKAGRLLEACAPAERTGHGKVVRRAGPPRGLRLQSRRGPAQPRVLPRTARRGSGGRSLRARHRHWEPWIEGGVPTPGSTSSWPPATGPWSRSASREW